LVNRLGERKKSRRSLRKVGRKKRIREIILMICWDDRVKYPFFILTPNHAM